MLSHKIFPCLLTFALAFPLTQSVLYGYQIFSGDQAAKNTAFEVPTILPGWQYDPKDKNEIKERDLIRRVYRNQDGQALIVLSRQTSAYRVHDPIDCAKAAGLEPQTAAELNIASSDGTPPLHASLIETTKDGKKRVGLAWFQSGNLTAGNQRKWNLLLVANGAKLHNPVCRQTYLVLRAGNDENAAQLLCDVARHIYAEQQ